jgi:hypothetical protein
MKLDYMVKTTPVDTPLCACVSGFQLFYPLSLSTFSIITFIDLISWALRIFILSRIPKSY